MSTTIAAIWKESRKRNNTTLASIPPKAEPAASNKYAELDATPAETLCSCAYDRAATTNKHPHKTQNTLRQMREVSSIGTGPANSPGTVWKKALEARTAQIVGSRLAASRHWSAATDLRALPRPGAKRLPRLLPAAVHKSHVASVIPIEISFPLKTTMSSRMSRTCPMTAENPSNARAALTSNLVPNLVPAIVRHEAAV
jgi:hypothetical protein